MATVLTTNAAANPSNTPASQYLANFAAARDAVQRATVPSTVTDASTGTPVSPSDTLYYSSAAPAATFLTPQTTVAGSASGTAIWPSNGVAAGNWNSCLLDTCTLLGVTATTTTGGNTSAVTINKDTTFASGTTYAYTTAPLAAGQGLTLGILTAANNVLLDRTKPAGWGGLFVYTCTYSDATALSGSTAETESLYFQIG